MVGEKGERNKKRRDIATAGVKLMKGCNKKKSSETVKCRENRAMNYSVVILSDSSL